MLSKVTAAIQWLKLNHCGYTNLENSDLFSQLHSSENGRSLKQMKPYLLLPQAVGCSWIQYMCILVYWLLKKFMPAQVMTLAASMIVRMYIRPIPYHFGAQCSDEVAPMSDIDTEVQIL